MEPLRQAVRLPSGNLPGFGSLGHVVWGRVPCCRGSASPSTCSGPDSVRCTQCKKLDDDPSTALIVIQRGRLLSLIPHGSEELLAKPVCGRAHVCARKLAIFGSVSPLDLGLAAKSRSGLAPNSRTRLRQPSINTNSPTCP